MKAKPNLVVADRIQPAPAQVNTAADAERALAANLEQAAAHRKAIEDFESRRQALLLTDGNDAELKQLGDAVDDAYLQLEKLEARRVTIMRRLADLRDVERASLRDRLVAAHAAVFPAYVAAHRAAVDAVAAVLRARQALETAGFRNEMNTLPVPPMNLIDMNGLMGSASGPMSHLGLDHYEVQAERAHRILLMGAK